MSLEDLSTETTAVLFVTTAMFEVLYQERLPVKVERESYTVELEQPLEESGPVHALLVELGGAAVAGDTADVTPTDDDPADLTVDDQRTDGDSIEIASLRTDVDASVFVYDEVSETIGGSGVRFRAGDEVESLSVPLDEPLSTSQPVRVTLFESNAGLIAEDTADVTVE